MKKTALIACAFFLSLFAVDCTSSPRKSNSPPLAAQKERPAGFLTMDAASIRARQIHRVSYELFFDLSGAEDHDTTTFTGTAHLRFSLRPNAEDLSETLPVDFYGGRIHELRMNGHDIGAEEIAKWYDGHQLHIPIEELREKTEHDLSIRFEHPYSLDGTGLFRFFDPEDDETYVYSNLEPYAANRVFPCFDQPDLKARYTVTARAPKQWSMIANTLEKDKVNDPEDSDFQVWRFKPSETFSTYVFALIGGNFASWKSAAGTIPLRLFARRSQRKYVDTAQWFKVTREGLKFFPIQFGVPYPYQKYDQVIVPDFPGGAMENVATVTFSERYLFRSRVTEERKRGRTNVILHEMAHMWFGNLVTMKWWNSLWLNESFATFMATWAQDEALQEKEAWKDFFEEKSWAYSEDQLVTTHPIETPVGDTEGAFAQFDGITYGKGAAVLKQLFHLLGEDHFREGLQRYFLKFSGKNTSIRDFFRMMSEASNVDLNHWQRTWLLTEGLNHVQVAWECAADENGRSRIEAMTVLQRPDERDRPLRKHKMTLALLGKSGSKRGTPSLHHLEKIDVLYEGSETPVTEAVGKDCPRMVLPNLGDHDYARFVFDERTRASIQKDLSAVEDPFLRRMIWESLWHEVVEGESSAPEYFALVLKHGENETHAATLELLLSQLYSSQMNSPSIMRYIPETNRAPFFLKLEKLALTKLKTSRPGTDLQLVWFQFFSRVGSSKSARRWAKDWLSGKTTLDGMGVEVDRRWEMIEMLARSRDPDADAQINTALEKDRTDRGKKRALAAEALKPDPETKRKWMTLALDQEPQRTVAEIQSALRALWPVGQEHLAAAELDTYLLGLSTLSGRGPHAEELAGSFAKQGYPAACNESLLRRAQSFVDDQGAALSISVRRTLLEGIQGVERCLRSRRFEHESS